MAALEAMRARLDRRRAPLTMTNSLPQGSLVDFDGVQFKFSSPLAQQKVQESAESAGRSEAAMIFSYLVCTGEQRNSFETSLMTSAASRFSCPFVPLKKHAKARLTLGWSGVPRLTIIASC